ncbi:pentatricopeptide repeat-containing protein At4g20770 [Malania oleifera]|uniref:pentatricopeptide repeat-containing protein At4g20770 n=1 Tax=Malania oleifera TaxID=397392 RepID=UPI0025AE2B80|nr:pentatricopeptide repeat-containing protein At4g20770 [Malania oleifera]
MVYVSKFFLVLYALPMERNSTHLAHLLQSCIDKKAHLAGKLLHAHILRVGLSNDTFLSNRLLELYSICGALGSAIHLFYKMPHKDVYSWNAMLGAYSKAGEVQDAHSLFVKMPERNTVSWNTLITTLVRRGSEEKALDVYYRMIAEGYVPTRFTLASVLSACGALTELEHGRRCHGLSIKNGLDKNLYVSNAVLCLYAKCRSVKDAIRAFEDVPHPNEVSFTAMMGALAESDRVEEAVEVFRLVHRNGVNIDSVALSSILGVLTRGGTKDFGPCDQGGEVSYSLHGQQVHCITVKLGFEIDLHLSNSLLDMYAKNGNMDKAELIFANMQESSVVSWNIMIAGYGQKLQSEKALYFFQRMSSRGLDPDEITYINMLAACVRSGDIETGRQMFDKIPYPSLSSWNALLSGYSQNENHKEALELFREMQFRSFGPDRTTLAIILSSCAGMDLLECGKQVHAVSQKAALHTDIYVASGLIGIYSKCGKVEMAKHVFYRLRELDIVCWNALIAGLSFNTLDSEAFTLFKQMRKKGILPSEFSYTAMLSCCVNLCSLSQGRQVHAQLAKDGYITDVCVGSTLINMYCKCGDVNGARHFFDLMPEKNTITWNQMIHGFAQNGRGDEAVRLYENMIVSGEKPDGITFIAVLSACNHAGLVDAGIKIFNSMQPEHGVEALLDHYTCIIDCLGRSGRFHEVEILVDKMPYKDDPVIWEVLLSSCRVHGNVSLARRAADELFHLDPQNSVPYVLLTNIYASLGRWDEARAVRELMSAKQVIKDPGYSWIEHKNDLQPFIFDQGLSHGVDVKDETFFFSGQLNDKASLYLAAERLKGNNIMGMR